jgi:hypothetical protein
MAVTTASADASDGDRMVMEVMSMLVATGDGVVTMAAVPVVVVTVVVATVVDGGGDGNTVTVNDDGREG